MIGDRPEMKAGASRPVAHRPIQNDALASVDFGLPVKRQMIAEFRDDDLGDERLSRQPAGHNMLGSMRLRDSARTASARVFGATCHQHAELGRDHVETLGDILANHRHRAATARTHRASWFDHTLHARQMSRQPAPIALAGSIATIRFALDDRRGLFLRGVQNALSDFDVLERKIKLIRRQFLRLRAELLASQIVDDDFQPPSRLLGGGQRRLMFRQVRLRPREQRFQGGVFFRKRSNVHIRKQSYSRRFRHAETAAESIRRGHPASAGRRVRSGRTSRQSSPSNNAANCAGDNRITPSRTPGQTNLPPSRRLCASTRPV